VGAAHADIQCSFIFIPFTVAFDGTRAIETGGTGLGLTIAHNLMTALGGSLVLSNLPSSGLRVEIRGPRSAQL